jgi:hypothetical protein
MRYWFILILLIVAACSNGDIKVTTPDSKEPTREELRKAMRYHGILFAKKDDSGEWYFLRDGKHCRLFAHLKNQEKTDSLAPSKR